uniref:Uncharacterized protein n=1 Tax=viral metagenome TaxID=1070528 RepID=A0A6C0IYT5_9ZZZZ
MVKVTKATKTTTKPQGSSLGRFNSCRGVVSTPKPQQSGYVSIVCNGKNHNLKQTNNHQHSSARVRISDSRGVDVVF